MTREDRLREAMREALENERTAKSALFKREQAEAEAQRLREQYDTLVGQFEAVRSQVGKGAEEGRSQRSRM